MDSRNINRYLLNELIVFLMIILTIIFSFSQLKAVQTSIELLLFSFFIFVSIQYRFKKQEFLLVLVFWFVTAASFFLNSFSVFLTNAKALGLAIYTMLYFTRVHHRSKLIDVTAICSICLMVINFINPSILSPIVELSKFSDFNKSRFGGIFFNAHLNGYFIAVWLIFILYQNRQYFPASLVVLMTGSKFVFVSYFFQGVPKRIYKKYLPMIIFMTIISFLFLSRWLVQLFNTAKLVSLSVILYQLFDIRYYYYVLSIFPNDYVETIASAPLSEDFFNLAGAMIANEIGYFQLFYQAGNILAVLYLMRYFKLANVYTIFIIISMLHYGFILSPIVVYMMVVFSYIINKQNQLSANNQYQVLQGL